MYNLLIKIYSALIHLSVPFNQKAKEWVNGRKGLFAMLEKIEHGDGIVWFHCASLGEYEQAIPLIINLKLQHPNNKILVTFFSPSGFNHRRNIGEVDYYAYLPADTRRNASRFLDIVKPVCAIFCKYDFWFNFIKIMYDRNIPQFFVSSIFRKNQYFFKWYGGWFRKQLGRCFEHLFVQNEESLKLLKSHGVSQCSLAGDTRFDRVHQIALAAEGDAVAESFLDGYDGKVMVAGSTWPPDEELISKLRIENPELRIILAPHVINEEHLKQIEGLMPDSIRYSRLSNEPGSPNTSRVLIIDNIGLLSKLYRYADVAYIGGGFGVGIHNILEAVTFGKPVLFGPNHRKFKEACDIIALGGGFSHIDGDTLARNITPLLTDNDAYRRASQACTSYMEVNLGSTDKILATIEN